MLTPDLALFVTEACLAGNSISPLHMSNKRGEAKEFDGNPSVLYIQTTTRLRKKDIGKQAQKNEDETRGISKKNDHRRTRRALQEEAPPDRFPSLYARARKTVVCGGKRASKGHQSRVQV